MERSSTRSVPSKEAVRRERGRRGFVACGGGQQREVVRPRGVLSSHHFLVKVVVEKEVSAPEVVVVYSLAPEGEKETDETGEGCGRV